MQYDMEGYRISRCFRAIGYYVREYCFPKNDDIFLLNRILSLLAKFLEANPSKTLDIPVVDSDLPIFELDEESGDTPADEVLESKGASAASDLQRDETPESDYMREKLTDYLATIEGDPDAEATLNLVLKLQERELLSMSSESSDEEEDEIITAIYRRVSMSASAPKPSSMQGEPSRGRKYQRSQSCRYARYPEPRRPAPIVRAFSLDFHCEVDENRGIAYGTGGALLGTIRRVVRQLNRVQCLRLTDLFLAVPDARRLILDLHETASTSLMDLNLMHLHKLSGDPTVQSFESLLAERTLPDPNGDSFWYLLDPRWLGARPVTLARILLQIWQLCSPV
ncbi:unnamed protein product [Calicophoron daubneyi]|uniref:Uncharacterized protein n=1 Tax=Calicophoron daubneyi TaxID=300641 RepID=A0AAV2TSS5_CALDB